MHHRLPRASGLALVLALAATAVPLVPEAAAQQAQAPQGAARQGRDGTPRARQEPRGTPLSEEENRALGSLLEFVGVTASMAGAASICQPQVAERLQGCTQAASGSWSEAAGVAPLRNPAAAAQMASGVWQKAYSESRNKQSSLSPPMTCAELLERIARSSIARSCGILPGQSAVPQQGVPQQPRQSQPVQPQGGLRLQ